MTTILLLVTVIMVILVLLSELPKFMPRLKLRTNVERAQDITFLLFVFSACVSIATDNDLASLITFISGIMFITLYWAEMNR